MCCNHSYVIKYTALAGTSVACKLFTITLKFNAAAMFCIVYAFYTNIQKVQFVVHRTFLTKCGIN